MSHPTDLLQEDVDDLFPWSWHPWINGKGDPRPLGGISSPNGRRTDGSMHTYWLIAGDIWEPHGRLICDAVNAWVKPGWKGRFGRWILTRA